jgi:hypothetical protein
MRPGQRLLEIGWAPANKNLRIRKAVASARTRSRRGFVLDDGRTVPIPDAELRHERERRTP